MKIQIIRTIILAVTVLSSVGIYCATTQYQVIPLGQINSSIMWNRRTGEAWIINAAGYEAKTRRGVWHDQH